MCAEGILTLRDLLQVEDDASLLEFRRKHTGLPPRPQVRIAFLRNAHVGPAL